jgi:hypothetical protein
VPGRRRQAGFWTARPRLTCADCSGSERSWLAGQEDAGGELEQPAPCALSPLDRTVRYELVLDRHRVGFDIPGRVSRTGNTIGPQLTLRADHLQVVGRLAGLVVADRDVLIIGFSASVFKAASF